MAEIDTNSDPTANINVIMVPLPQTILDKLKCIRCSLYISVAPIFYDENMKLVCGRCQDQNSSLRPAKELELLLDILLFPCCYSNNGCTKELTSKNVVAHEDVCEFGSRIKCPLVDANRCDWQGHHNLLHKHCKTQHFNLIKSFSRFDLPILKDFISIEFLELSKALFFFRYATNELGQIISFNLCQIVKHDEEKKFTKYKMGFYSKCFMFDLSYHDLPLYTYNEIGVVEQIFNPNTDLIKNFIPEGVDKLYCKIFIFGINEHAFQEAINILQNYTCHSKSVLGSFMIVCEKGHTICSKCIKLSKVCPSSEHCHTRKRDIMDKMIYACKNSNKGCKFTSGATGITDHEKNCKH